MKPCEHRLKVIQHSATNDHPDIYACQVHGYCTLERSRERTIAGPIRDCATCEPPKPQTPPELAYLTCPHRGEPTGEALSCQCGIDRTIYQCGLNGKCLKQLPPGHVRETFGESLTGVTVCRSECQAKMSTESPISNTATSQ